MNHAGNCFGNTPWPELVNSIKPVQGFPLLRRNHIRSEHVSQRTDLYHICLIPPSFSKILKVYCVFKCNHSYGCLFVLYICLVLAKQRRRAKTVTCRRADQGVGSGTAFLIPFFSKFLIVPHTTYSTSQCRYLTICTQRVIIPQRSL